MTNLYGRRLRELRGDRLAANVARAVGISRKYLYNLERGVRRPKDEATYLRILTDGLGLSKKEASRVLVDIRLAEFGVRAPHLRRLCTDYLTGKLPFKVLEATSALFLGFKELGENGSKAGNGRRKTTTA